MRAAARGSERKRASPSLSPAARNFTATGRSSSVSCARYTLPPAPTPMGRISLYSSTSPGGAQVQGSWVTAEGSISVAVLLLEQVADASLQLFGRAGFLA